MKKIINNIFSTVLILLLTLSLFFTFIFMSVGLNVNNRSINKYIISSGYSKNISEKILEKLYNYADINGLPHEIFDDFVNFTFTSSEVYEYIVSISQNVGKNKYIDNINKKQSLLASKIKKYALNNMELTEKQKNELDSNVDNFVKECVNVYKNEIKSSTLEQIYIYIEKFNRYFEFIISMLIIIDILLVVTLVFIQKWKHRGYRYVLYSLISTELMLCVLSGYFLINNIINRLTLTSKELYNLVTSVLNGCLNTVYISIFILLVLIFVNIIIYIKNKKKVSN